MVHQELVPPQNILEGDVATIRCAHGDTVLYPLAKVQMEVNSIEVAVSTTLPVYATTAENSFKESSTTQLSRRSYWPLN